jgi:hypothetical protein
MTTLHFYNGLLMNAQTSRYSNVNFQHRSSCLESQWQSLTSSDIISGLNGIGVDPFHFIYIYMMIILWVVLVA